MSEGNNAIKVDPRVEYEFIKLQAQCWQMSQQITALVNQNQHLVAENQRLLADMQTLLAAQQAGEEPEDAPQKLDL